MTDDHPADPERKHHAFMALDDQDLHAALRKLTQDHKSEKHAVELIERHLLLIRRTRALIYVLLANKLVHLADLDETLPAILPHTATGIKFDRLSAIASREATDKLRSLPQ